MADITRYHDSLPAEQSADYLRLLQHLLARWTGQYDGRTREEYTREVADLIAWWEAQGRSRALLLTLSVADAQEYAALLRRRVGPAAVNRSLAALSSFWQVVIAEAEARGYRIPNPWSPRTTRRPRVKDVTAERILSEEEVARLVTACRQPVEKALILTLYHSGLRVSEAVTATWRDVHMTPTGLTVTVLGKGGKTRTTGLSRSAYAALREIRRPGVDWLFPGESREGHMARETAARIVATVARRAKVRVAGRPVSPHWMRHSHATHALHHGGDLATIRDSLGHADLRTTSKYLHAQPGVTSTDYLPGGDRGGKKG